MRKSLAEQLSSVLAYRNAPDHEPEPIQSNWTVTPANDNKAVVAEVDYAFERHLRMTPSVKEIMRQVEAGPTLRNDAGQIVAIGNIKFSDGEQFERAYRTGPDGELVAYARRMEVGAMLRTREEVESMLGGRGYSDVDLANSNAYYADVLKAAPARYIRRTKRRTGKSFTVAQSRANLAQAIANTQVMPPVTRYPTGLPCGAERIGDCFVGYLKPATGSTGAIAWEDIGQVVENAKVWRAVRKALRSDNATVIDAAMSAQSMEDLGDSGHKRTKERQGKRKLIAANDNLASVLRKFAA